MLGPLANLVVNIIINSQRFNQQMQGVHGTLNRVALLGKTFSNYFTFTAAAIALRAYVNKLKELETGFIRIERVSKEFRSPRGRGDIFNLAQEISGAGIEDIQKIMKTAAQLGIRGKENMLEFSRAVAMMANVTGESADLMATDLGKILQVFNLLPTDAMRVSNAILQVADDFNTTESEITNIVRRIGAFSKSIGLSVDETIAFAATMKDVGVNTEIAASSLYSFFARLQTNPVTIAKVFGFKTPDEIFKFFKKLRQEPVAAIVELLEKIKQLPPGERLLFFKELELYGVRNAAALGTLAEKVDRLKVALLSANQGASDNVKLLQNQWDRAKSLTGAIDDLSDAWKRFMFEFSNTGIIQHTLNYFSNYLDAITNQLARMRGLTLDGDFDINDIQSVKNKRDALQREVIDQQAGVDAITGNKFLPLWARVFGQELARFHTDFFLGHQKDIRDLKILNEIIRNLEDRQKNKDELRRDLQRPDDDAVRREFINVLKGEKQGREHFKGFMGLTEAWKNWILDHEDDPVVGAVNEVRDEVAGLRDDLKNKQPVDKEEQARKKQERLQRTLENPAGATAFERWELERELKRIEQEKAGGSEFDRWKRKKNEEEFNFGGAETEFQRWQREKAAAPKKETEFDRWKKGKDAQKNLENIEDQAEIQNENLEELIAAVKNVRVGAILG